MRATMQFVVTGTSKDEIESKLKERVAKYLGVESEQVEDTTDIDINITVGEDGPMQLTFTAMCSVRLKQ